MSIKTLRAPHSPVNCVSLKQQHRAATAPPLEAPVKTKALHALHVTPPSAVHNKAQDPSSARNRCNSSLDPASLKATVLGITTSDAGNPSAVATLSTAAAAEAQQAGSNGEAAKLHANASTPTAAAGPSSSSGLNYTPISNSEPPYKRQRTAFLNDALVIGARFEVYILEELASALGLTTGRVCLQFQIDGAQNMEQPLCMVILTTGTSGWLRCAIPKPTGDLVGGTYHLGWRVFANKTLLLITSTTDKKRMTIAECLVRFRDVFGGSDS